MKDGSKDTLSAPSLLQGMEGSAPEQQRILAALEGKSSSGTAKTRRIIKGASISVLAVFCAAGLFWMTKTPVEGGSQQPVQAFLVDDLEEAAFPSTGQVAETVQENGESVLQIDNIGVAVVEEVPVAVPSAGGQQNGENSVKTENAQPSKPPAQRSTAASRRSAAAPGGGRSNTAKTRGNAPEHDVIVLSGVLDAFYTTEGIPVSVKNRISTRLADCGKQQTSLQEGCRQKVCAKFWGRVPECPKPRNQ